MAGFRCCAIRSASALKRIRRCLPSPGRLMAGLSLLALLFFSYVMGAAALYLDLPSAEFLRKAFAGALAWNEREFPSTDPGISQDLLTHVAVTADEPRRTWDGFTLVTTTEASR